MIRGNTEGIKDYILKELDSLYEINVEKNKLIEPEMLMLIAQISNKINRDNTDYKDTTMRSY